MSQKNHKQERQDKRRADELEKRIGPLVQENARLKANLARSEAQLHSAMIDRGILKTILSVVLNNQRQGRAFFSKRALDKALDLTNLTFDVAAKVIGPDERATLIKGELLFQERKKREGSLLILPDEVVGIDELYTPEARKEAEDWVDKGIIVQLIPKMKPVLIQDTGAPATPTTTSGSTFLEDPQPKA